MISKMSKNTGCCITISNPSNCIARCLLKNRRGSNAYELYVTVFYAQLIGRMALFSALCCHTPLGCIFYKIRTSKRHTKPKYVKSKFSYNKVKEYFFQVKTKMALVISDFCHVLEVLQVIVCLRVRPVVSLEFGTTFKLPA